MVSVDLRESVFITLNGSGAGTAKVGPLSAREVWRPQNVSVSANANPTNEAMCVVLVGDANTLRQRDVSVSGSSGDATDKCSADKLKCGEFVWAVWTGGDANAQATLTVTGSKEI